jgi:hypothetical protein
MINNNQLFVGLQVVYVPRYIVERNKTLGEVLKDKDTEFGFVTSWNKNVIFCRFWLKEKPGELRTVANSEACDKFDLFPHESVSQTAVIKQIQKMRRDPERYGWREGARWKER